MKTNKKFLGKSAHRLESNPKEKIFSDAWIKENSGKFSMLQLLLSDDGGKTPAEVTDRDEMIAATVIQWLGSPVGFNWLMNAMGEVTKFEIERKGPGNLVRSLIDATPNIILKGF